MQINLDKEGPDSKYYGMKKISAHVIIRNPQLCRGHHPDMAMKMTSGMSLMMTAMDISTNKKLWHLLKDR